jgi:excisionase family DNA binding protein
MGGKTNLGVTFEALGCDIPQMAASTSSTERPGEVDQRPLTRDDVLSTAEAAELLGLPRSTIHYLARRGELPARRVGRRWLFLRDRLAAALAPLDEPDAWRP